MCILDEYVSFSSIKLTRQLLFALYASFVLAKTNWIAPLFFVDEGEACRLLIVVLRVYQIYLKNIDFELDTTPIVYVKKRSLNITFAWISLHKCIFNLNHYIFQNYF